MRVLVVEDDALVAKGIVAGLRAYGMTADAVGTAKHAEMARQASHCDAMVLDLGLPDEDGMGLLDRLRKRGDSLPILVLTARDAVEDRVAGLQGGADDYLVKPFDFEELVARLHALMRRAAGRSANLIVAGPLRLDPASGDTWLNGGSIALTRRETALLTCLVQSRGRVLSAEQLKDSLYGFDLDVESNAVNVHIHNLRRKLGKNIIETVRGLGYRFGGEVQ
jgi:DNA-binding response OmpR family regulator